MPRHSVIAVAAVMAAITVAATPVAAGDTAKRTGVIVIKVTINQSCGPERYGDPSPPPRPFDANVRIRNRRTGQLWVIRSGEDGSIRRRFPVGAYKIRGGKPREPAGLASTKDVVHLELNRHEIEHVAIHYDNGCR